MMPECEDDDVLQIREDEFLEIQEAAYLDGWEKGLKRALELARVTDPECIVSVLERDLLPRPVINPFAPKGLST